MEKEEDGSPRCQLGCRDGRESKERSYEVLTNAFICQFIFSLCIFLVRLVLFSDLLNASNVFVFLYSGRELFLSDSSLFVDDAEVYDKYQREDESNATEEKVSMFPYMHVA